jgi:hypothetical protein
MSIHAPIPKFGVEPNYDFFLSRFSNVGKLLSSVGALKAIGHAAEGRFQIAPANGDKLQMFFICDGTETKLEFSDKRLSVSGIFDIYVNGVLDSSGYDDYAAAAADVHREITLSQPIRPGLNTIELRVNGKNVAASSYYVSVMGASLQ